MDQKKLETLREKYAGTEGGDIFDPVFRKAASAQFSEAGKRAFPMQMSRHFSICLICPMLLPIHLSAVWKPLL